MENQQPVKIFAPQKSGTPCAFCPNWITEETEVNGRLYVSNGKPICAVCRVLRGNHGKAIRSNAEIASKSDKISQTDIEMKRIEDLAIESQARNKMSDMDNTDKKRFTI